MKTKEQWAKKLDDNTSDAVCVTQSEIELIQLDALEHAASLLTANAGSPTRGFNAIHRLIVKLKSKTVAAQPNNRI